jgi:hypothetical protein
LFDRRFRVGRVDECVRLSLAALTVCAVRKVSMMPRPRAAIASTTGTPRMIPSVRESIVMPLRTASSIMFKQTTSGASRSSNSSVSSRLRASCDASTTLTITSQPPAIRKSRLMASTGEVGMRE